jgi:hypothetical protein
MVINLIGSVTIGNLISPHFRAGSAKAKKVSA